VAAIKKKTKKDPTTKAIVKEQKAAPARDKKNPTWVEKAKSIRKSAAEAEKKPAKKKKTSKN
jgi:hypothetical protein